MDLLLIVFSIYALYTAAVSFALSRRTPLSRSIATGTPSCLGLPVSALLGLVAAMFASELVADSVGQSGFTNRSFAGALAVFHLVNAWVIVRAALAGQGYRSSDWSPSLGRLIFRLVLFPILMPVLWLTSFLGMAYLRHGWIPLLFLSANPMLYAPLVYRLTLGRGTFIQLPESPLASELRYICDLQETQFFHVRTDAEPVLPGGDSDFGPALARCLRWAYGHGRLSRFSDTIPFGTIPGEFLQNVPAQALTAAVAVRSLGLEYGFSRWRRAATQDDSPRTIPAFFRALAEFDRFLLQPDDPAPLIRRYETSRKLKMIAHQFGSAEDYARALTEVRVVLGGSPESAPNATGVPPA